MFVKCCLRLKIERNILQTEGQKFSMMTDMPVTICFVIPQNQNKKFKQKSFEQKSCVDFNAMHC